MGMRPSLGTIIDVVPGASSSVTLAAFVGLVESVFPSWDCVALSHVVVGGGVLYARPTNTDDVFGVSRVVARTASLVVWLKVVGCRFVAVLKSLTLTF